MRRLSPRVASQFGETSGLGSNICREIMTFDLANTGPIDIEEPVAPRLDRQEQQDKQHREKQNAVVSAGCRERHRQHRRHDGDRPVARSVQPVAPAGHATDLRPVKMRHGVHEFRRRKRLCGMIVSHCRCLLRWLISAVSSDRIILPGRGPAQGRRIGCRAALAAPEASPQRRCIRTGTTLSRDPIRCDRPANPSR